MRLWGWEGCKGLTLDGGGIGVSLEVRKGIGFENGTILGYEIWVGVGRGFLGRMLFCWFVGLRLYRLIHVV